MDHSYSKNELHEHSDGSMGGIYSSLGEKLWKQQQALIYVDLVLVFSCGSVCGVHKCVMAATSKYLRMRIYSMESAEEQLLINDLSFDCFEPLLKFMYTGDISFQNINCLKVKSAAQLLQLEDMNDTFERLPSEIIDIKPDISEINMDYPPLPTYDIFANVFTPNSLIPNLEIQQLNVGDCDDTGDLSLGESDFNLRNLSSPDSNHEIIDNIPTCNLNTVTSTANTVTSELQQADTRIKCEKDIDRNLFKPRRRSTRRKVPKRQFDSPECAVRNVQPSEPAVHACKEEEPRPKRKQYAHAWKKPYLRSFVATVQCPHCSYAFHHSSALKLHLRLRHAWTQRQTQRYRNSVEQAKRAQLLKSKTFSGAVPRTCRECDMTFTLYSQLRLHMLRKHTCTFECGSCAKIFASKNSRNVHQRAHDCCVTGETRLIQHLKTSALYRRNITQEALLCRFCNKTLPTKRRFMCHLTGHDLNEEQCAFELSKLLFPGIYFCEVCLFCSINEQTVQIHMKKCRSLARVTSESQPDRDARLTESNSASSLNAPHSATVARAIPTETEDFSVAAADLPETRSRPSRKLRKSANSKRISANSKRISANSNLIYSCKLCPHKSRTETGLASHVMKRHDSQMKAFTCDLCDKGYRRLFRLRAHKYKKHGIMDKALQLLPCSVCGKILFTPFDLAEHEKQHEDDGPTACEQCGKTFKNERCKEKHMLNAHENRHCCTICGKTVSSSYLHYHMQLHDPASSYRCPHCDYKTPQKPYLHEHMFTRHGDRSKLAHRLRQCEVCGYEAVGEAKLQEHKRQHTDEKPFRCSECHMTFTSWSGLNNHRKWKHQQQCFSCSQCHFQTKTSNALSRHMRRRHLRHHPASMPYKCLYCDYRSDTTTSFDYHCRKMHKGLLTRWIDEESHETENDTMHDEAQTVAKQRKPRK